MTVRACDKCRPHGRCLDCIERDGLTKAKPAASFSELPESTPEELRAKAAAIEECAAGLRRRAVNVGRRLVPVRVRSGGGEPA